MIVGNRFLELQFGWRGEGLAAIALALMAVVPAAARAGPGAARHPFGWDRIGVTARPGGFWWWLGSSVSEPEVARQMRVLKNAGFGALLVCPIYAYRDPVLPPIPYLSDRWVEVFRYTLEQGRELGTPVDMTMGPGWPMGGPWVRRESAERDWRLESRAVTADASHPVVIRDEPGKDPIAFVTVRRDPEGPEPAAVVTPGKAGGTLEWRLPVGRWHALIARMGYTNFDVYVAGPGGVGPVFDYWSPRAFANLVEPLDAMLEGLRPLAPRAAFCDSFEGRQGATPAILDAFQATHGYDLRPYMHQFLGETGTPENVRLWHDYRQVCARLHIDFVKRWTAWARTHGMGTRYQYIGDPANPVDTSMQATIHEDTPPFSSSAAHLAGHALVSHEAFTWGAGHNFIGSLDWFRKRGDADIIAGINHMIYHGVPFTPASEPWPGPMYYAGGSFGETQPWFGHIRSLNDYFARLQHISQSAKPDVDVLVYWPTHDLWRLPNEGGFKWGQPFVWRNSNSGTYRRNPVLNAVNEALARHGCRPDVCSDSVIQSARALNGRIRAGKMTYRALVIPGAESVEPATLRRLEALARNGAAILFVGRIPQATPHGLPLVQDTSRSADALRDLSRGAHDRPGGAFLLSGPADLPDWLGSHGVPAEGVPGVLALWRARGEGGAVYIVRNQTEQAQDVWVPLARSGRAALVANPRTGEVERARVRPREGGGCEVRLLLQPTEMLVVGLRRTAARDIPELAYEVPVAAHAVSGPWTLTWRDYDGGLHTLAKPALRSWTEWPEIGLFSGTVRYETMFDMPQQPVAGRWLLDVGEVRESAGVVVNGVRVADAWTTPFRVDVTRALKPGRNTLALEVANLAQNRVIDLTRRGVDWQKCKLEENDFTGYVGELRLGNLKPLPSGLLGPVTLLRAGQEVALHTSCIRGREARELSQGSCWGSRPARRAAPRPRGMGRVPSLRSGRAAGTRGMVPPMARPPRQIASHGV